MGSGCPLMQVASWSPVCLSSFSPSSQISSEGECFCDSDSTNMALLELVSSPNIYEGRRVMEIPNNPFPSLFLILQ